ncbi:SDR family NAD(P)-dependent oxidoreductase [Hoeflea ulvae]|uniref:SDR family oxidoreductase n=1 Tax=Hoeflea ulvae TaxID=2983764 RepID=A0ABT3YCZ0_9HYPH|nr:SDR family NAD(P)-dependent oxidoreductase [Hoeflea ulvae]MCY0093757.1 SDR family oxidoreductase [Hoeflea ulvae]
MTRPGQQPTSSDDRTAIVTGAATGFGKSIVETLLNEGIRVCAVDLDGAGLKAAQFDADRTILCELDLTDRIAVAAAIPAAIAELGHVDCLVNNAGGVVGRGQVPIEDIDLADWDAVLDVNLGGTFLMSRLVAPSMKAAGFGRIINITSGAGFRASRTGVQAYTTAKHALHGLTRQLAHELGPYGVTVNAVAPGLQPVSPGTRRQWESYSAEKQRDIIESIPLRSLGTAEDVADAVLFLGFGRSGYITGQILPVNGGSF